MTVTCNQRGVKYHSLTFGKKYKIFSQTSNKYQIRRDDGNIGWAKKCLFGNIPKEKPKRILRILYYS